jgi:hypothetical protein
MDYSDLISLNQNIEETSKNECVILSNFNMIHQKYFHLLNSEYSSSDKTILNSFKRKMEIMNNSFKSESNKKNEINSEKRKEEKELIEKAKEILLNPITKQDYLYFLFVNYVLSQPNSLEKLKNNFHFYVFPFYLFSIEREKSTKANYLIIDYISRTLNFYYKDKLEKGILGQIIKYIKREKEKILIVSRGGGKIFFSAEVQQQQDLIYVLLLFLLKISQDISPEQKIEEHNLNVTYQSIKLDSGSELENENYDYDNYLKVDLNNFKINDLRILKDEKYLPTGIILKSQIEKSTKGSLSVLARYMVLGNSNIIIFK